MTLPASPPINMQQVATELGVSFPLSLNANNVRGLAGKLTAPISLLDLLGKSNITTIIVGATVVGNDTFYGYSNGTTLTTAFGTLSGNSISGFACSAMYSDVLNTTTIQERYDTNNMWSDSALSPGDDPPSLGTAAVWDGTTVGSSDTSNNVDSFPPYSRGSLQTTDEHSNFLGHTWTIIGPGTSSTTTGFIHLTNSSLNGYVLGIYSGAFRVASSVITLVDTSGGFAKYSLNNPGIFVARTSQTLVMQLTPT